VKKQVTLDSRAEKEIGKFPKAVRAKIKAYTDILAETGQLYEPFAKKLTIRPAIYEIRIKHQGIKLRKD